MYLKITEIFSVVSNRMNDLLHIIKHIFSIYMAKTDFTRGKTEHFMLNCITLKYKP